MLDEISVDDLDEVVGGTGDWESIRAEAGPYCPNTVAAYPNAPANRSEAQAIGDACLAEMDRITAMFARRKIQAGIDKAFP